MKRVAVVLIFLLAAGCTGFGEASQAVDDAFMIAMGMKEAPPTPTPEPTPPEASPTADTPGLGGEPEAKIRHEPGFPTDKFQWAEDLGCGPADPKNDEFVRNCIPKFREELGHTISLYQWLTTRPSLRFMNIDGQQNRYATYLWGIKEAELYGCAPGECGDHGCHAHGTLWNKYADSQKYCCDDGTIQTCPGMMYQTCGNYTCRTNISWRDNIYVVFSEVWSDCPIDHCLGGGKCLEEGVLEGGILCSHGMARNCTEGSVGDSYPNGYSCARQGDGWGWILCDSCWEVGTTCTFNNTEYTCLLEEDHYVWVG